MNKKRKPKYRKWIIIIIVIGVVGLGVNNLLTPKVIAYESAVPEVKDITTYYSFSGNIDSKNRETIIAERTSQIDVLYVSEGEIVESGKDLINPSSGDNLEAGIKGEVSEIYINENDQVSAGTKLMEIVDYENLEVSVKVDEYELAAIEAGKEVTVKVNSLDQDIKGTIESVSKEGQVTNGVTYFIAIVTLEKDDRLKVGMSTEITMTKNQAIGAVTLPMTAIQFEENNTPFVFLKGVEGEPIKTLIETGVNDGTTVEILSGVSLDDQILYTAKVSENSLGFGGGNSPMGNRSSTDGEN
ncbi:MAG: HlyD family efflux transporter periplasmic adaptor subunit [Clostridiaceae bacterium]